MHFQSPQLRRTTLEVPLAESAAARIPVVDAYARAMLQMPATSAMFLTLNNAGNAEGRSLVFGWNEVLWCHVRDGQMTPRTSRNLSTADAVRHACPVPATVVVCTSAPS